MKTITVKRTFKYLLWVCVPATVLTVAGIVLLVFVRGRFLESEKISYGRYTDSFARSVGRDIGRSAKARSAARFSDDDNAVFHWSPRKGLLDSKTLPPLLKESLKGTNVTWIAENRKTKHPRIGWMRLGGETIAWWRLADDTVAGGVVDTFEDTDAGTGKTLFAVGFVMVGLMAAFLFAGGFDLWRNLERERRENAEKTSFLSNATHELKTPLSAIRLWSEMLATGRLKPERARHAADVIVEENRRMIRLVENLLDFSRLEQKRRVYREEDVDLRELVDSTAELMRGGFQDHGLSVKGDESIPVRLDSDAVRQILVNILGNASKYAAAGGPVEMEAVRTETGVRISVADRGPGLPPGELEHVFERFFRGVTAAETDGGGLGLGLSISQGLARGMGGGLAVAPREGGGLVFTIDIPVRGGGAA